MRVTGQVLGLALWSGLVCAADAPMLKLLTEDYPPFNMQSTTGQISGMATDIVRELMARAGYRYSIELLPWLRAYNRAVLEPGTCVFSTTRTEQRENQFKWVGPVVENPWVLYARADDPRQIRNLEATRPYRLGGYTGDAVAQYLIARNFEVDLASNDAQNVRKLLAGRIDFWATGKYSGAMLVAREKAANLKPILTFNNTYMYLACHAGTADQQVGYLNELLAKMQKDGTVAKINARYLSE